MKCPVLHGVSSSALKSTTSCPNAAPFSVPARSPITSASPAPLWPPIGCNNPSPLCAGSVIGVPSLALIIQLSGIGLFCNL